MAVAAIVFAVAFAASGVVVWRALRAADAAGPVDVDGAVGAGAGVDAAPRAADALDAAGAAARSGTDSGVGVGAGAGGSAVGGYAGLVAVSAGPMRHALMTTALTAATAAAVVALTVRRPHDPVAQGSHRRAAALPHRPRGACDQAGASTASRRARPSSAGRVNCGQ
jgi:hypothetical protein